jgi:membrane-associated phospholipid phosphatase
VSPVSSDRAAPPPSRHLVWRALLRVRRHFWFKCVGASLFTSLFFVAYIHLLKNPAGPVRLMPVTALDHWVGLVPWVLPIYLSLWVYVSLPPALMTTRGEVAGFGLRMGAVCLIGLAIFWLWPNAVPPANIDWARYPGMAFLKGVDAAGNAFPSLHVATAVFAGFWLHQMAPDLGLGRRFRRFNIAWCVAIGYSTMATGQHVFVDVAGGVLLGGAMAWLTYPSRRPSAKAAHSRTASPLSPP